MRTLAVLSLLSCALTLQGQTAPPDPGPPVGATVPGFEATDQNGKARTLESLMGPKGLMLVFYRSADW